ncbi:MAG: glycosyltransferase, partial [Bacteroidetes bacterium]
MRVSLITVCYQAAPFIRSCIDSVLSQDHSDIEYIVIDGGSTDGTVEAVRSYGDRVAHLVSEPDEGLYDAMNKGLQLATGELVGILNADDFYPHPEVISRVVAAMAAAGSDTLFGDLVYVREQNPEEVVRFF